MASEKTKTSVIVSIVVLVAVLVLGGIAYFIFKVRAQAARERALVELKRDNPVEYYILHTPMVKSEEATKGEMVGKWELAGAGSAATGQFNFLPSGNGYFKSFTLTNWAIVTYDRDSNVVYSASGHYTLQGELYTENIEAGTGRMSQLVGRRPNYRIRVDGDKFYMMGAGKKPGLEEMWQRVE